MMFRRVVGCLLVIALALTVGNVQLVSGVNAVDVGKTEGKVFDTATARDDFVDNHVMVVLNNAASLKFRNYTTSDFPEIACRSVRNLSTAAAAKVQAKLRGEKLAETDIGAAFMNKNVKTETFKTILCLELETPGKENVLHAIEALEQRGDIYYVGPDYIMSLDMSRGPVEPDASTDIGWHRNAIELNYAWQIETGSNTVKVGVLDMGIDASHPDLQGKVNTSLSRNFAPDSVSATTDSSGHGTHVAGIIGGSGNNYSGIQGICQDITLVSLRVLSEDPFDPSSQKTTAGILAEAINYAEQINIPVLNISMHTNPVGHLFLAEALANYSGLVVCSAGNHGVDLDFAGSHMPATMDSENIICVGASTTQYAIASFSNYGSTKIDLFAPGSTIASCFSTTVCRASSCTVQGHLSHGYHIFDGTSMATPMVAGVAALILSADSSLTCSEIKDLILNNVKEYAAFTGKCVSGGLLNAKNIFSLHTMHGDDYYYVPVGTNRHRRCCEHCDVAVLEPHAWDGAGGCMLCGYSS